MILGNPNDEQCFRIFEIRRKSFLTSPSGITVQIPKELHRRVNKLDHALQAPYFGETRRYFRPRRRISVAGLRRWLSTLKAVDHK